MNQSMDTPAIAPLRVLLVEDSEDDAMLIERALRRGGLDIVTSRVENAVDLGVALNEQWDVVICDFALRGFTGIDALALCRANGADFPFILISGTIGEEIAAAAMKAGASDYVMKRNMTRLAPAVLREIHEAQTRANLRQTELKLIESERRFHAFMDASPVIVAIDDDSGRTVYMNQGWKSVFGATDDRATTLLRQFQPHDTDGRMRLGDGQVLMGSIAVETTEEITPVGASPAYWKNTRFPFMGASGQRFLGKFATDITRLKQSEEIIRKLAYHDPLTNLPNRRLMLDRLGLALASDVPGNKYNALMFLDLDQFKALNDTHGHYAGDQLLFQTAERLSKCVGVQDTVSRTGGDEFVIILKGLSEQESDAQDKADVIGRTILDTIKTPYLLDAGPYALTTSIGIVLFGKKEQTRDELMKRADLALYYAKAAGRNKHLFFDPVMQARIQLRAELEYDLRQGLEKNQFVLHYQPQVDSASRLMGVEALLRLQHPEKGVVMPLSFIGVAEETGLIIDIGYWVLETACSQLLTWSTSVNTAHLTVSVNVSARQFSRPEFVSRVLSMVALSGINPNLLTLELTESLLLTEIDLAIEKMMALRQSGLQFSLDDFGTGYSSLSYLKRLPLHELKIDRSFVQDVLEDANDAVIIRAIIALGHSFGLSIIAEGVETLAQRDFLTSMGCNRFQGYYFGRPVPAALLKLKMY